MYNEIDLINLIRERTGYETNYTEESNISLIHESSTKPKVFVGHVGIRLQHPEQMYADGYIEVDNPEVLMTEIQFLCLRTEFAKVRTDIVNAYKGYSPFLNDSNYSSLVFLEAATIAKTNSKIWFSEIIGLVMPRVS